VRDVTTSDVSLESKLVGSESYKPTSFRQSKAWAYCFNSRRAASTSRSSRRTSTCACRVCPGSHLLDCVNLTNPSPPFANNIKSELREDYAPTPPVAHTTPPVSQTMPPRLPADAPRLPADAPRLPADAPRLPADAPVAQRTTPTKTKRIRADGVEGEHRLTPQGRRSNDRASRMTMDPQAATPRVFFKDDFLLSPPSRLEP
jgi:hypothetical protein